MKLNVIYSIFFFLLSSIIFVSPKVAKGISSQDIPGPAECYFSAVAASDLKILTECFQSDAVIIDVNRKISGIQAIRSWADNEVIGGRYEILAVVSRSENKLKLLINFLPPGFKGKGFNAHYTFEFNQGKIIRMNLQYA